MTLNKNSISQLLTNPITEAVSNADGIEYVICKMGWCWNVSKCLLFENQATSAKSLDPILAVLLPQMVVFLRALRNGSLQTKALQPGCLVPTASCYGSRVTPGKGKTMLVNSIIEKLSKTSDNWKYATKKPHYFFCQVPDSHLNNAVAIIWGASFHTRQRTQPSAGPRYARLRNGRLTTVPRQ